MKFSTFFEVLLVIGVIFFMFDMMLMEGNAKYPGANVNDSEWANSYDYSQQINSTMNPLVQKFEVIGDPDQGFFSKIAAGLTAIPYAVVLLPQVIFGGLGMGGAISTKMLMALAIPGYIILVIIISILVWGLLKLVSFWGRWEV